MTDDRYRELLEAGPSIKKADFQRLKSFVLQPRPLVLAVLVALSAGF